AARCRSTTSMTTSCPCSRPTSAPTSPSSSERCSRPTSTSSAPTASRAATASRTPSRSRSASAAPPRSSASSEAGEPLAQRLGGVRQRARDRAAERRVVDGLDDGERLGQPAELDERRDQEAGRLGGGRDDAEAPAAGNARVDGGDRGRHGRGGGGAQRRDRLLEGAGVAQAAAEAAERGRLVGDAVEQLPVERRRGARPLLQLGAVAEREQELV